MTRCSFNSVRSYFFRAEIAERDREQREYGGRSLEDYDLEDFRALFARATSRAIDWDRARDNRWDAQTRAWARPFRRIER